MLAAGDRYQSARTGAWIEIKEVSPERIVFDRVYAPRTGHADPHLHLDFTQNWEALEGEGKIEVDGEQRDFSAGDLVSLSPDTRHRDPWTEEGGKLKVRARFEPNPEFIVAYAEAWGHHLRQGTVNDQDEMPIIQILVIAHATNGQSYRAGVPVALQKTTLPLVAAIGRLRGYRASYD